MSINVGPFDGRRHKCELNNGTVENQASSFLQTKMGYTFYGIEVRCLIMRVNKKLNTFYMPRPPREGDSRKRVKRRKGKIVTIIENEMKTCTYEVWNYKKWERNQILRRTFALFASVSLNHINRWCLHLWCEILFSTMPSHATSLPSSSFPTSYFISWSSFPSRPPPTPPLPFPPSPALPASPQSSSAFSPYPPAITSSFSW